MEQRRYHGSHYGKPFNDNDVHSYSYRHQRLYQNCHSHRNGTSVAKRHSERFACCYLRRSEQYSYCYRRRYISVEYRRNGFIYYSKSNSHNNIYCNCNRRERLYQNGHCNDYAAE